MVSDDIVTRLREKIPVSLEFADEGSAAHVINEAADEIERLRKLTGSLARSMMPFALLMTKEEQETVMKAVRGE